MIASVKVEINTLYMINSKRPTDMCVMTPVFISRFRRTTYVTPKSYLSFIQGYKTIYAEKRSEVRNLAERSMSFQLIQQFFDPVMSILKHSCLYFTEGDIK